MASTNVRISTGSHETLQRLAQQENESMQAVLDKAIEHYRRERFLLDANTDFAALKRKRSAWKDELAERKIWSRTLRDGLEEE